MPGGVYGFVRCVAGSDWQAGGYAYWNAVLLPPATKLGQGYVFTGVCDSVHRGGGST